MRFKWKNALGAAALAAALCGFVAPPAARAQAAVSVSFFHQQLAPHGRWVVAGSYGDCWVPGSVAAGWSPYVDGQWAYTDYGWTWNSSDPWGDITYHYGTWAWVPPYGWVWVPGTVWAPAWVTWAYTDDFIGWAPVPPSFVFSVGGFVGGPVVVAHTQFVFVPARQFVGVPVNTVRVAASQNAAIFSRATKVTGFPVSNGVVRTAGLPKARVERAMGHQIEQVPISRTRTEPVSLSRAGFASAKSIPVVAPKDERAREIKAQSAPPASRSASTANARPSREAQPAPQRNAPQEQQQVQRKKAQPQPQAENPPTETHQAQHRNPPAKPKAKPQPPPEARPQAEQPQPQPAPRPNPEAKPDGSPPVHQARSAQPKPHPVQKPKPQPEREKPQSSDRPDQK